MWKLAKNLLGTIADLVIVKARSVRVFLKKLKPVADSVHYHPYSIVII